MARNDRASAHALPLALDTASLSFPLLVNPGALLPTAPWFFTSAGRRKGGERGNPDLSQRAPHPSLRPQRCKGEK